MSRAAALFHAALAGWVEAARRASWAVVVAATLLTAVAGWYSVTHLALDTDTTDMLSANLPFRRDADRVSRTFPQLNDNIVIVIDAPTAGQAEDASLALGAALRARPGLFPTVFNPAGEPFLRRNGLLYLDANRLSRLVDRLAGAQAFLAALWKDSSLRGLFGVLQLALEKGGTDLPKAFANVVNTIAGSVEDAAARRPGVLSWTAILDGAAAEDDDRRRIIVTKPKLNFGSLQPAGAAMDEIRRLSRQLEAVHQPGVRVRLTGSAPLAEEELASVLDGMGAAGMLSLALVIGLLFWGLRSTRLVAATLVTLLMGLSWTAGFAAIAVGRLNLISVAFAVLFIGLSVDFGIHFALRAREGFEHGKGAAAALRDAAEGVGDALTLCAIAAAIAFFSFLPTDYVGIAELGLIAGVGMFIALFANLTLLPALIALMPPRSLSPASRAVGLARPLARRPGIVLGVAVALAVVSIALLPRARFDFDPLNLKDPHSESVATLVDLMGDADASPYTIDVLAPSMPRATKLARKLETLPAVRRVITLDRFVPKDQDEKLAAIDSAAFLLLPALQAKTLAPPDAAQRLKSLREFRNFLAGWNAPAGDGPLRTAVMRLRHALTAIPRTAAALAALEHRLLATLPGRLGALRQALEAGPVKTRNLPRVIRDRYVASDGAVRIEVQPKADLRDPKMLRRFVAEVRSVAPRATGAPVVIVAAGDAVLKAFLEAAAISVVAIGLLVALLLGRLRDVVLVFAPLVLAALLTVAAAAALGLAFNFANVIVLPLLFGLGVASAIHLVMRSHAAPGAEALFATSTPRAVTFSALTTIGSFASIALSSHPGTASMGILLTIAITLTLCCTLGVLPALMAVSERNRRAEAG